MSGTGRKAPFRCPRPVKIHSSGARPSEFAMPTKSSEWQPADGTTGPLQADPQSRHRPFTTVRSESAQYSCDGLCLNRSLSFCRDISSKLRARPIATAVSAAALVRVKPLVALLINQRRPLQIRMGLSIKACQTCLGLIRLAGQYSSSRMEAAAERALVTGTCRYQVRLKLCWPRRHRPWAGGNIACSSRDMTEFAKS